MEFLPVGTNSTQEIRELTPEEIKLVEYVFTERGHVLPNPSVSTFVGVVDKGEVLGFIVLEAKLHAEPMWIKEGHSNLFNPIVRAAERVVLNKVGPIWVYVFTPAGRIAQMAQAMGMQLEPWVVLSKLVTPEEPIKPVVDLNYPAGSPPISKEELEQYPGSDLTQ